MVSVSLRPLRGSILNQLGPLNQLTFATLSSEIHHLSQAPTGSNSCLNQWTQTTGDRQQQTGEGVGSGQQRGPWKQPALGVRSLNPAFDADLGYDVGKTFQGL